MTIPKTVPNAIRRVPQGEDGNPKPFQRRDRPDACKEGDLVEIETAGHGPPERGRIRRVVHLGGRNEDPRGGFPVMLSVQFADRTDKAFTMGNRRFPPGLTVYRRFYVYTPDRGATPTLFDPDTTFPF